MKFDSSESPSVSVVMLAYNHGPYIKRAIEGVLNQQANFPVELLIGEDHSIDDTLTIARAYEQQNPEKVRVITSDTNVGAKKNSRRLESACLGKYIAYCEGDDYWHDTTKLQNQVSFLESNPDYTLVHTEYRSLSVATGKETPNAGRQPADLADGDAYNEILAGRRLVLTLTACARRASLVSVLADCPECYDPAYLMGDTQRWLELARRGKVKCLRQVTATHLLLPESASQSRDPRRVLRFVLSTKQVVDHYLSKYDCPTAVRSAAIARIAAGVLACACEAGDFEIARSAFGEYRNLGRRWAVEPYLYYLGSRSPRHKALVKPVVFTAQFASKAARKLGSVFKIQRPTD